MPSMTSTDHLLSAGDAVRRRLDRTVLIGNLISGAVLLAPTPVLLSGAWVLMLIGAAYVAAASYFLAYVYARPELTWTQEGLAWVLSWVAAVAVWTVLFAQVDLGSDGTAAWPISAWAGLGVATPCYLVWQAASLAARELLKWNALPATPQPAPPRG